MREPFELELLGGATERRYRRLRPEIEALPWGSLDPRRYPAAIVEAARKSWTLAAFQEHRTGAACAATLEALLAARAPVDLIAVATRFPLDELVHVEMCARLAAELGGAAPLYHDGELVPHPSPSLSPLLRAAELVVRVYCVGEAVSIPLLRGTARSASLPLVRGVLSRIVKDEAAHGAFGWWFLEWADPLFESDDRAHLRAVAAEEIGRLEQSWDEARPIPYALADVHALGWMESQAYLDLARRSIERDVKEPLRHFGLYA